MVLTFSRSFCNNNKDMERIPITSLEQPLPTPMVLRQLDNPPMLLDTVGDMLEALYGYSYTVWGEEVEITEHGIVLKGSIVDDLAPCEEVFYEVDGAACWCVGDTEALRQAVLRACDDGDSHASVVGLVEMEHIAHNYAKTLAALRDAHARRENAQEA